jgi:acyl dehydratase
MTAALTLGAELGPLWVDPISRTTLALFAGSSGDHIPLHIDIDVAKSAGLEDVFAHGMLSMAYLGRLLTDNFGVEKLRSFQVRFAAITPVHGQPTCRGTVRSIHDVDGRRLATLDLAVTLADGTTTLVGEAVVEINDEEQVRRASSTASGVRMAQSMEGR